MKQPSVGLSSWLGWAYHRRLPTYFSLLSDDSFHTSTNTKAPGFLKLASHQEEAMSFATANQNVAEYIRKCPELDGNYFTSLPVRLKYTQMLTNSQQTGL